MEVARNDGENFGNRFVLSKEDGVRSGDRIDVYALLRIMNRTNRSVISRHLSILGLGY